jgi:regulator of replication initiation timing
MEQIAALTSNLRMDRQTIRDLVEKNNVLADENKRLREALERIAANFDGNGGRIWTDKIGRAHV